MSSLEESGSSHADNTSDGTGNATDVAGRVGRGRGGGGGGRASRAENEKNKAHDQHKVWREGLQHAMQSAYTHLEALEAMEETALVAATELPEAAEDDGAAEPLLEAAPEDALPERLQIK